MDIWTLTARGGVVMYPLLFCAFVSLMVIIERCIFWIRVALRRQPDKVNELLQLIEKGKYNQARELVEGSRDYVPAIKVTGFSSRCGFHFVYSVCRLFL